LRPGWGLKSAQLWDSCVGPSEP